MCCSVDDYVVKALCYNDSDWESQHPQAAKLYVCY